MTNRGSEKPRIVKSSDLAVDKEYILWICDIKRRYRNAQVKAAVKINSEQLLFNWQLGRDLVIRRVEEKWGKGVVEQVSLDLQAEFPEAKGFGTTNLWYMKKWYQFYSGSINELELQRLVGKAAENDSSKLQQVGRAMQEEKVQQVVGEMAFPLAFSYVPWGHHILIITKCQTINEAAFYIKRTIEEALSRSALDDYIRSDLYHKSGAAITNFPEKLPAAQGKLAQEILKGKLDPVIRTV